jgi:hypothetical protein
MKTCLVVAFYFGERESCKQQESLKYINAQKHNLKKYRHNLSEIIFVIAEDGRKKTEMRKDTTDNITYIYRKNKGLSFASWMKVVKMYKNQFDYYIFLEDDYCFVKDNFDKIMIDEFNRINQKNDVNYVVTYTGSGISTIGITSSEKLKKLNYFDKMRIKFHNEKEDSMRQFLNYISPVDAIDQRYNVFPYWGTGNLGYCIQMYGAEKHETREQIINRIIVCAYQMLDENYNININHRFTIIDVPKSRSGKKKQNIWMIYDK